MTKLNKAQARKLFNQGTTIQMIPHKASPYSPWFIGAKYSQKDGEFDNLVNKVEHYNCNNELGYYLAYYVI